MDWHYVEQGQQLGPVNDDRLLELERSGKITPETYVWREGMTDWKPLREVRLQVKPSVPATIFVPPAQTAAAPEPPVGSAGPEAVCAECGKIFPVDEMIRHGSVRICANCKPVFMQKLSEGAQLNTGELKYAGFGIRFGAKLLDGLILGLPMMAVFVVVMFSMAPQLRTQQQPGVVNFAVAGLELGMFVVQMAYVIFFVGRYGATPGKMICKLKIVTAEGAPVSYGRAAGRFFAEILSGMICYIGYFLILFDQEKRALHDHICKTRVVYK